MLDWKSYANWAKKRPRTLRVAGWLDRGNVRHRYLDCIKPPPAAPRQLDLSGWQQHSLAVGWIGHATVLIRMGGMTILTDPVFANRVGLGLGLITGGPRRLVKPALCIRQLPPLDLILISHAHFDHLDRLSLARLPRRTRVITSAHNGDLVRDLGFRHVDELHWGDSVSVGELKVTAQPARHWGARVFHDDHRGYAGYLLENAQHRVLYAGDTAFDSHLRGVGPVDVGIFCIGGYEPYNHAHATPEQVWRMAQDAQAKHIIPIHHSTFRLSYEPDAEPIQRLLMAADGQSDRVVIRSIGELWSHVPPAVR